MDFTVVRVTVWAIATEFGLKILGAIALWILGRWLIGLVLRLISTGMNRRHLDPTIISYVKTALSVLLTIILVIAILGVFGIQTTSFAALLAAGGVAIGLAWNSNRVIREAFGEAGFPIPEQYVYMRSGS